MSEPGVLGDGGTIEASMRELGGTTIAMAPPGPRFGLLALRAELARGDDREARLLSFAMSSGLCLLGLALAALALRMTAGPEPFSLLLAALPVVLCAIVSGLALLARSV